LLITKDFLASFGKNYFFPHSLSTKKPKGRARLLGQSFWLGVCGTRVTVTP